MAYKNESLVSVFRTSLMRFINCRSKGLFSVGKYAEHRIGQELHEDTPMPRYACKRGIKCGPKC